MKKRDTERKKISLAGATVVLEMITEGSQRCCTIKQIAKGIWPIGHITKAMESDVKKSIGGIVTHLQPDYDWNTNKEMKQTGEIIMPVTAEFFRLSAEKDRSMFTDAELSTCVPGRGPRATAGLCLAGYSDPVYLRYMEQQLAAFKGKGTHLVNRATHAVSSEALESEDLKEIGMNLTGIKKITKGAA